MKVLFICKGNWFRSQVAEAIYNQITGTHDAVSAGTYVGAPDEPEGQILSDLFPDPVFFEAMESHGLYLRNHKTKKLTPEMLQDANVVISMAQEPYIPDFLSKDPRVVWRNVEDYSVVTKELAERTYDTLTRLIKGIIAKENI